MEPYTLGHGADHEYDLYRYYLNRIHEEFAAIIDRWDKDDWYLRWVDEFDVQSMQWMD